MNRVLAAASTSAATPNCTPLGSTANVSAASIRCSLISHAVLMCFCDSSLQRMSYAIELCSIYSGMIWLRVFLPISFPAYCSNRKRIFSPRFFEMTSPLCAPCFWRRIFSTATFRPLWQKAPTTPPTTAPMGPATLPTTAPTPRLQRPLYESVAAECCQIVGWPAGLLDCDSSGIKETSGKFVGT